MSQHPLAPSLPKEAPLASEPAVAETVERAPLILPTAACMEASVRWRSGRVSHWRGRKPATARRA